MEVVTISAVVVWLFQRLKKSPLAPWIHQGTDRLNKVVAIVAAAFTAVGINWFYDSSAGVLTITGLTLQSVLHFGYDWLRNLVTQELVYRVAIKRGKK